MPRFEIPDVRGETRDVAIPASALDLTGVQNLAQTAYDTASAVQAEMPVPATIAPAPEKTAAAVGGGIKYARDDHAHPRLTSVTQGAVLSGNTASVTFTRAFANEPGIDYQELPSTANTTTPDTADTNVAAQPTQSKVIAWVKDGSGSFTGCTLRVWKSQTVPQNLATLLLGGVFNLFAASVVGTRFSVIAVARSDVS